MRVTPGAELLVVGPRGGIMLKARPGPMVERLPQPRPCTHTACGRETRVSRSAGDRRRARVGPQRGIIPVSQRAAGLGEHRGGDHSSNAWQGLENLGVAMLGWLALRVSACASVSSTRSIRRSVPVR